MVVIPKLSGDAAKVMLYSVVGALAFAVVGLSTLYGLSNMFGERKGWPTAAQEQARHQVNDYTAKQQHARLLPLGWHPDIEAVKAVGLPAAHGISNLKVDPISAAEIQMWHGDPEYVYRGLAHVHAQTKPAEFTSPTSTVDASAVLNEAQTQFEAFLDGIGFRNGTLIQTDSGALIVNPVLMRVNAGLLQRFYACKIPALSKAFDQVSREQGDTLRATGMMTPPDEAMADEIMRQLWSAMRATAGC